MLMVATVLRCRLVRKDFVESHVVAIDAIACRSANDQVIWIAQVADQRGDGDVDDIVAEAPAVRPSAWNEPAIFERILNVALQHVAAEDAQTRIASVVRVRRITGAPAGETSFACRQVDLDQIRNIDSGYVGAISLRSNRRVEDEQIDQARQFRRLGVLSKELAVSAGACA